MEKKRWGLLFLAALLIGIIILGASLVFFISSPERVNQYLYVNSPVPSEILVVEGWVSDQALTGVIDAFNGGNYTRIVTTGGPLDPYIPLFRNGFLEYNLEESGLILTDTDTLVFRLSGTPAKGTYPHYRVTVNGLEIGEGYVVEGAHDYYLLVEQSMPVTRIRVIFDNDDTALGEDRNLFIESITLGDQVLPSRFKGARVFSGRPESFSFVHRADLFSYAEACREKLIMMGIPAEKIVEVPAPETNGNRTFISALAVAQWIDQEGLTGQSFNIFSEGLHARRTWTLYKYALKNRADIVGILSTSNIEHLSQDPEMLRNTMLRELAGNVYYRFFFNKRRLKKEFLSSNLPG